MSHGGPAVRTVPRLLYLAHVNHQFLHFAGVQGRADHHLRGNTSLYSSENPWFYPWWFKDQEVWLNSQTCDKLWRRTFAWRGMVGTWLLDCQSAWRSAPRCRADRMSSSYWWAGTPASPFPWPGLQSHKCTASAGKIIGFYLTHKCTYHPHPPETQSHFSWRFRCSQLVCFHWLRWGEASEGWEIKEKLNRLLHPTYAKKASRVWSLRDQFLSL